MKNQTILNRYIFGVASSLSILVGLSFSVSAYPPSINERFALRAITRVYSAEFTYLSTTGSGNFGALDALGQAQLIDAALAAGNKYGYVFAVTLRPATATTPADFALTATPRLYRKTGRMSFYIDINGEIHGADNGGRPAASTDPVISYDFCTGGSVAENELCTVQSVRTLHGAELTYAAAFGNGSYAGLAELRNAGLINSGLGSGELRGYSFTVTAFAQTTSLPARFRISAVPQTYSVTGIRSFFTDESGVIRGADKNGAPADENDPPINE